MLYSAQLGDSALVAAVQWLDGTLLGTIATLVAIIAVAWVGMMMLQGRIDVRRGITVILGCFLVFGASAISKGMTALTERDFQARPSPPPVPAVIPILRPTPAVTPSTVPYDPYAGASLPQ